jgi:hypothetical protein
MDSKQNKLKIKLNIKVSAFISGEFAGNQRQWAEKQKKKTSSYYFPVLGAGSHITLWHPHDLGRMMRSRTMRGPAGLLGQ